MVTTCLVQFQLCNSDASGAVCHVHALVREIYDHEEEAPMSTEEGKSINPTSCTCAMSALFSSSLPI